MPVVDSAKKAGEECEADYSNFQSGIDDCDAGSFCWNIQSGNGKGTCMPLCQGTPDAPECPDGTRCMRHPSFGEVAVCMEMCDPLLEPKDGEYTCTGSDAECPPALCFPIAATGGLFYGYVFPDAPGPGEQCNALGCKAGALCLPASETEACGGSSCCATFCDLLSPGCEGGTVCKSVFQPGAALENVEHVGACLTE